MYRLVPMLSGLFFSKLLIFSLMGSPGINPKCPRITPKGMLFTLYDRVYKDWITVPIHNLRQNTYICQFK